MDFLKVKNWEIFQHYKTRNPPWIKLHVSTLNDRKFASLDNSSRGLLIQLWILASENEGEIPFDLDEIKFRLRNPAIKIEEFNVLINKGFLKICKQPLAPTSKRLSEERREETETEERREESTEKAGRHFSNRLDKDLLKRIESAATKLESLQSESPKKKKFNPFQWIQRHVNKKAHPESILYCLEALSSNWKTARDPFAYLEKIVKVESQNLNARDSGVKDRATVKDIEEFWESSGEILLRSSKPKTDDEQVKDSKANLAEQLKKLKGIP